MWLVFLLLLAPPDPQQFKLRMQEGMAAFQRNDLDSARRNLEEAARLDPSSAPAWFLLSQVHARRNDLPSALDAAGKASRHAGKDPALLYNLALFYRQAGQFDQSLALGKRALEVESSPEVHTVLGQAYLAKKDYPNAINELAEARRMSPYSEDAIFQLSQAHLQSQDFPGAIRVLEDGRKTFDRSPQLELALGVAYYGARRFADAIDRFLRVTELAPDVPQAYYFMGRILEHASNRLPEVAACAVAFEKRQPRSPIGYVLHAKTLILQLPPTGSPPEAAQAQALLEKALSIKEDLAEPHYLMGVLLERQRDYPAAALQLERSIALNDKDPAPHFRLARVYDRLGRKEDAAAQRALHEKLNEESGASTSLPATRKAPQ